MCASCPYSLYSRVHTDRTLAKTGKKTELSSKGGVIIRYSAHACEPCGVGCGFQVNRFMAQSLGSYLATSAARRCAIPWLDSFALLVSLLVNCDALLSQPTGGAAAPVGASQRVVGAVGQVDPAHASSPRRLPGPDRASKPRGAAAGAGGVPPERLPPVGQAQGSAPTVSAAATHPPVTPGAPAQVSHQVLTQGA